MSSKKQLRRKRREARAEAARKQRVNPATMFLVVVLSLIVILGVVAVLSNREDVGPPPWPGAVWSAEHGHWH